MTREEMFDVIKSNIAEIIEGAEFSLVLELPVEDDELPTTQIRHVQLTVWRELQVARFLQVTPSGGLDVIQFLAFYVEYQNNALLDVANVDFAIVQGGAVRSHDRLLSFLVAEQQAVEG